MYWVPQHPNSANSERNVDDLVVMHKSKKCTPFPLDAEKGAAARLRQVKLATIERMMKREKCVRTVKSFPSLGFQERVDHVGYNHEVTSHSHRPL